MVVEFALIAMIFLTLLIGIMEFGRWLFTLNAASEATRWGARLAAVCDKDDADIKAKMRLILKSVTGSQISVNYAPAGCALATCKTVTVALVTKAVDPVNYASFTPMIPFMGVAVSLPAFTTSLPLESMESTNSAGEDNEVCK